MKSMAGFRRSWPAQYLRRWQFRAERYWARARSRRVLHFLHIGKTAGTAIRNAFDGRHHFHAENSLFVIHHHGTRLEHIPEGDGVFFVVRDPLSRFVSGFYSRMRKGQPRIFNPWTDDEELAFSRFSTPNELGEALSSNQKRKRDQARHAMKAIGHIRNSYWDWFGSPPLLEARAGQIAWIGRQERLSEDFDQLRRMFALPESVQLPQDEVRSHRNPDQLDKKLSDLAISSLKEWYRREYMFLAQLIDLGLLPAEYTVDRESCNGIGQIELKEQRTE